MEEEVEEEVEEEGEEEGRRSGLRLSGGNWAALSTCPALLVPKRQQTYHFLPD